MAACRRVYDSRHLPRTGMSSGTLRSVIEYGLRFLLLDLRINSNSIRSSAAWLRSFSTARSYKSGREIRKVYCIFPKKF